MSYESYMREVLGYTPRYVQDVYATNDYYGMQTNVNFRNDSNLEEFYPDTYKKIYPLVCKECNTNTMPLTQEILEQMTDNVYNSIEIDLKIETSASKQIRKEDSKNSSLHEIETRNLRQNNTLRDLIKILIIRELLNQGKFPGGNRPPFPPRPTPRPPFLI